MAEKQCHRADFECPFVNECLIANKPLTQAVSSIETRSPSVTRKLVQKVLHGRLNTLGRSLEAPLMPITENGSTTVCLAGVFESQVVEFIGSHKLVASAFRVIMEQEVETTEREVSRERCDFVSLEALGAEIDPYVATNPEDLMDDYSKYITGEANLDEIMAELEAGLII